jgi:SOS-response transcriptional repressor LexA
MKRGRHWEVKNRLILALAAAEQQGHNHTWTELAKQFNIEPNTISGHLFDLSGDRRPGKSPMVTTPLVKQNGIWGQWALTEAGRQKAQELGEQQQQLRTNSMADPSQKIRPTRALDPTLHGIEYRGLIAAGPAIEISDEHLGEYIQLDKFDPKDHFALRVRGNSMVDFHICDGDLVILRRVDSWLNVLPNAIVAVLVPEGTDVVSEETLRLMTESADGSDPPALDHATLKALTSENLLNLLISLEQGRTAISLRGSQGTVRTLAFQVSGIVVSVQRDLW